MKRILTVIGTRPEAIKMAPVLQELRRQAASFQPLVCVTSQHQEMLAPMLELFQIRPDVDLEIMQENQDLPFLTEMAVNRVTRTLRALQPEVLLVQGDTTTAMAAALAGYYEKVPVGHVEAGLRTQDRYNPFPEEINRRFISAMGTFHFAPTRRSRDALLSEGHSPDSVFLTGNTAVDALHMIREMPTGESVGVKVHDTKRTILVTAHRRENFGDPLERICAALKKLVQRNPDVEIVYPVHLNPNVRDTVIPSLSTVEGIKLLEPMGYVDFIHLLERCHLVLTDSGGIQEEAPAFGKPVLVMREETERKEGIEAGITELVGTDDGRIVESVEKLLNDEQACGRMSGRANPYGDGQAARRIVDVLDRGTCTEWVPPK